MAFDRLKALFGYNATVATDRRQAPRLETRPEDTVLGKPRRARLVSTARDIERNLAVLEWTVAKHVGYLTSYEYRCSTGVPKIDARVEKLVKRYARKANCDAARRHSLAELVSLAEGRRVVDGDVFVHFTGDGRLQLIESDRVTKPSQWPAALPPEQDALKERLTEHGLVLDSAGAAEHYCVCSYGQTGGLAFERFLPAASVEHLGYFKRYHQTRGISPLAAALNSSQDLSEAQEYILAKIKTDALQGYILTRQGSEPTDSDLIDNLGVATDEPAVAAAESAPTTYEVPKGGGPFLWDMDPGDKMEILASGTPNANLESWLRFVIHQILLGLEIPYCFFDASKTSYKSYVAARYDYNASIRRKREPLTDLLDRIIDWRLWYWSEFDRPLRELLAEHGVTLEALQDASEWLPIDLPPTSRLEEAKADAKDISLGLTSRSRICRQRGLRFDAILDDLAAEQEMARDRGVVLSSGLEPGADAVEEIAQQIQDANEQEPA